MEDDYLLANPSKKKKTADAEEVSSVHSARVSKPGGSRLYSREYVTPEHRRQLLKRALDDVITYGISVRLAAESHGVAKSSLSDFIRRQNIQLPPRHNITAAAAATAASAAAAAAATHQDASSSSFSSSTVAEQPGFGVGQWRINGLPTLVPYQSTSASWAAGAAAFASVGDCEDESKDLQDAASTVDHPPHFSARSSELLSLGNGSSDAYDRRSRLTAVKREAQQALVSCDQSSSSSSDGYLVSGCRYMSSSATTAAAATAAAAWKTADLSQQLCEFINRSPSPFHAVAESRRMLEAAGFSQLREEQPWTLRPNQRAFVTRNGSTIFAFATGGQWQPGNGFSIVGAHTDSPCLRLKPLSQRDGAGDLVQCGVETYGGGLWYSWFDRDLTAAGRVVVRDSSRLAMRLVNLEAPVFKVPSLAIHLDRSVNEDGFKPNRESNLAPILCRKIAAAAAAASGAPPVQQQPQRHPPSLLCRVADRLGCPVEDIVDWELYLADTQPACVTGLAGDFVSSPRLDNLLSCYGALTALIEAPGLESDTNCRIVCLYDHEEIGSESAQGAGSALTEHFLRRLCSSTDFETAVPKSMLVSADVAHAVHPNYEDRHERRHKPTLFDGVVVKEHVNQRYATNVLTSSLLRECLRLADPAARLQDFVIRQDLMCGSTIGPILAAKLGLPTVDVGSPILGMHSIRETGAAVSPGQCVQLFSAFFQHYPAVRAAFQTE